MQPLAVITMVYNERDRIIGWRDHYSRQVGAENCFVVDCGSDDGSTVRLGTMNRVGLPTSVNNPQRQANFIADMAAGLLCYYKKVVYVEPDEILIANPLRFKHLKDYAAKTDKDVVTSIGFEIVQGAEEPPLAPLGTIGEQRSSAVFASSKCKTNLIGRRVRWAPGWHSHDAEPAFDELYLFGLRYADAQQAQSRLNVLRDRRWSDEASKQMQLDQDKLERTLHDLGRLPFDPAASIISSDGPVAREIADFLKDVRPPAKEGQPVEVPLGRFGQTRLPIGPDFGRILSVVRAGPLD